MNPARWGAFAVCMAVLLSACGFHLRGAGQTQLPASLVPLYLDKDSMSLVLYRELNTVLRAHGGQQSDSAEAAAAVLRVTGERRSRNVSSVDSRGRAQEYLLYYDLAFSLKAGSDMLIENGRVQLSRTLLFNPDTVLGISQEVETIYNDMMRDSAGLILLQVQAAGR